MTRWLIIGLLVILMGVGGMLLWKASSRVDDAANTANEFLQQITKGQFQQAYTQCTAELQKKHAFASFAQQVRMLLGATTIEQEGAFANWGWSRVAMKVTLPSTRQFEVEMFVVRENKQPKISIFRFREHEVSLLLSFLSMIRQRKLQQAYTFTSADYQKKADLAAFTKKVQALRLHESISAHWPPVKEKPGSSGPLPWDIVVHFPNQQQRQVRFFLTKEQTGWMITQFAAN